jgi:hypothetical protein
VGRLGRKTFKRTKVCRLKKIVEERFWEQNKMRIAQTFQDTTHGAERRANGGALKKLKSVPDTNKF